MRMTSITERLSKLGSEKWALHLHARSLAAQGIDILELTIGEPDIAPDARLLEECRRAMFAGRTGYSNGRGEACVIEALVEKYTKRTGRKISAENILCFPGTQTALFATMLGLVEEGDSVLVGDPLYATYEGVIRATGAAQISVPLFARNGFHMQPEDIEAAITPECKVLLLNSPHNPTGAILSAKEISAIGEICRQHDLTIVSDEVYEELIFSDEFSSPFDNAELAQRTVVVSSISKSHAAPGFRSGWAVGPVDFCTRLLALSETMLFGGQPFIADMTAYALTHKTDTAQRMCEAYKRRAALVFNALENTPGLKPLMPGAGMFILLDVRASGLNGEEFAWALLEQEQVATMPGASFGNQADGFVRLSLTVPDEVLQEACQRIARFCLHTINTQIQMVGE